MTITIGGFTCQTLTAQPFGYEGEARTGLTARTFVISGLLTPAQWQALLSAYNGWRTSRINDQDTLLSKTVGTTIALTVTANGVSVSALPCWFVDAPTGDQAGAYISTSVTLVDAAQALAVLLREQELANERQIAEAEDVDCAVIAANIQRQKDEADCEITALQTGLADDLADQELLRQKIDAQARSAAYTSGSANLTAVKTAEANVELLEKTAELAGRTAKAANIAGIDLDLQVQSAEATASSYLTKTAALAELKTAEASIELSEKQAELAGRATDAVAIATADLNLEAQTTEARADSYAANTATLTSLQLAEADIELIEKQAQLAGRSTKVTGIATVDLELEVQNNQATATSYAANTAKVTALKTAEVDIELIEKQAELAGRAAKAAAIAAADLNLEVQSSQAQATAFAANTTPLANREKAQIDIELLEYAAKITALTTSGRLDALKNARALDAVYESYISEDLPNLGTVTIGSATVTLTRPMDTRSDGPQVALTATGISYVTGPLAAHETRQIEGVITAGTYADVLTWYDTTIAAVPATGSWFPVTAPSATAEPFLISGVKSTRYTVTLEAKKII
jgi:hypothetical protein